MDADEDHEETHTQTALPLSESDPDQTGQKTLFEGVPDIGDDYDGIVSGDRKIVY